MTAYKARIEEILEVLNAADYDAVFRDDLEIHDVIRRVYNLLAAAFFAPCMFCEAEETMQGFPALRCHECNPTPLEAK